MLFLRRANLILASLCLLHDQSSAMVRPARPSAENLWHREHAVILDKSLRELTGSALLPRPNASPAECSSLADNQHLCVLSHGTEDDPIFNYATAAALDLFEYDWDTFVEMPSRLSAEAEEQAERARLLEKVATDGFVSNYKGVRVTRTGRRFMIRDCVIWNLFTREDVDRQNGSERYCGKAAMFLVSDVEWL